LTDISSAEATSDLALLKQSARTSRWQAFLAAVQFLTRVPVSNRSAPPSAIAASVVYFPLVGGLIGAFVAFATCGAAQVWPLWLAVIVVLSLEAMITGALHEDALADICDAFGGGWSREQILMILKDSRLGTYGVLGLGLAVALRATGTVAIVQNLGVAHWPVWCTALITSSAVGRWAMVVTMAILPPLASRHSLAIDIGSRVTPWQVGVASLWLLPGAGILCLYLPLQCALAGGLFALVLVGYLQLVRQRLGGTTGDCIGCFGYVAHVIVLLALAARWPQ